jgi:tetratricopeptide (TPR) repeat protein
MRLLALTLLAILPRPALPAAEIDDVLAAAQAAEADFRPDLALPHYLAAAELRPEDPDILQKVAQQYSDATNLLTDRAEMKRYAEQALAYSQRAVALAPDNPVNVLSVAISCGKLALFSPTREKISYSRLLKEETERALALNPEYAWAHHVLGRWHYEVATLGGAAKFFVKLIYGGLPPASLEQAVTHLERAVALDPDNLIHHLELGFAYWAAGDRDRARAQFISGLAMRETTINDAAAKTRAARALAETAS